MTAPSRIPHGEAVRNAVRVEWMRLETVADLDAAEAWLDAHGVLTTGTPFRGPITAYGPTGGHVTVSLGQVLAFNPTSGEFTVWDAGRFDEAHSEVSA